MPKVLVVDDDTNIREVLVFALQKHGYTTVEAGDGDQALSMFEASRPDLILLDIMMPELDGIEVCKRVRQSSNTPIIFMSAMDDDADMVLGLEIGGDDYVAKPFSVRQLIARVKAVLRRTDQPVVSHSNPIIITGNLSLNRDTYQACYNDQPLTLTVTEFNLLGTLMSAPTKVFSRSELIDHAYDGVIVSDRTIDSHIRRLRKKLTNAGEDPIHTVHGAGYSLRVAE